MDLVGPTANQKGLPSTTVPCETVLENSQDIYCPFISLTFFFPLFKYILMSVGCTVLLNSFYSGIGLIPVVQVQYYTDADEQDV